jgi:hypothetical protein
LSLDIIYNKSNVYLEDRKMKNFTTLVTSIAVSIILASPSVFATPDKNTLLHVSESMMPTVHEFDDWKDGFTMNGVTGDDVQVFDAFKFTLADMMKISFDLTVTPTFTPLKLNLFSTSDISNLGDPAHITQVAANGWSTSDSKAYEMDSSSSYLLQQLSISNGKSDFETCCLDVGDYFITLSGVPKDSSATYVLSNFATEGAHCVTAVPEPSTYALMLAGLGLVGFVVRRRKQA